jgi:Mg2+ and Co2+ transporter CorA
MLNADQSSQHSDDARDDGRGFHPRVVVLGPGADDQEVPFGTPHIEQIDPESELIWLTITLDPEQIAAAAATVGESADRLERLMRATDRPTFRDDGDLSAVSVRFPIAEQYDRSNLIACAMGPGWVITAQVVPSNALWRFGQYVRSSGWLGSLDPASFAGLLLEWLFNQYMLSFERLEREVDRFDSAVLAGHLGNSDRAIGVLVALRRQVSRLRRMLTEHRDLEVWISHAAEHPLVSSAAMQHLERIGPRIEQARQAADTARDSINGSFTLLMSTAAQRTNDIIKILTVVSVTLLPATLVTGIMGMNFHPSFFDQPYLFWVVVAVMSSLISTALIAARRGRWI